MKERPPAFQFYPRQFAGDDQVMMMDLDAVGAHILLMCAAGASPERCRIPAGTQPDGSPTSAMRNILRNPSADAWLRIKDQLLSGAWKVSDDGKWWESSGLRKVIEKQESFSKRQSDRARGRSRKPAETQPEASRNAAGSQPSSSSSSSSSKQNNRRQFNSTEAARFVVVELGLAGEEVSWLIRDAIDAKLRTCDLDEQQIAELMVSARRKYEACNPPGTQYRKSAKTFFAEPTWDAQAVTASRYIPRESDEECEARLRAEARERHKKAGQ